MPYVVAVQDVEDGSTDDGSIDCDNVEVQPGLGHDNHVHTFVTQRGCTGTITAIASGHEGESNIFYVLTARYTDKGGSDGYISPLHAHFLYSNQNIAFQCASIRYRGYCGIAA